MPGKHLAFPRFCLIVAALAGATACNKSEQPAPAASSAAPSTAAPAPSQTATEARVRQHDPPTGPILAILAGQGVGPIFIGATIPTIERQMELPCDEKTADTCRYFARALEFFLKDGKLVRIHVEGMDRPAGNGRQYGIFHGAIPPDIKLGMLPWAVHQKLGNPDSTDKSSDANATTNVVIEHYKGMDLEYDKLPNGAIVLAGVWVPKAPG